MGAVPRLFQGGTTSSQDDASSQKPGIRMMSMIPRLVPATDIPAWPTRALYIFSMPRLAVRMALFRRRRGWLALVFTFASLGVMALVPLVTASRAAAAPPGAGSLAPPPRFSHAFGAGTLAGPFGVAAGRPG